MLPVLKFKKNPNRGTSYKSVAVPSPMAKTLEKIILPHITDNLQNRTYQHGFKTTLHHNSIANNNNAINTGFNMKKLPEKTTAMALHMSNGFNSVHLHQLLHKMTQTSIPNTKDDIIPG